MDLISGSNLDLIWISHLRGDDLDLDPLPQLCLHGLVHQSPCPHARCLRLGCTAQGLHQVKYCEYCEGWMSHGGRTEPIMLHVQCTHACMALTVTETAVLLTIMHAWR